MYFVSSGDTLPNIWLHFQLPPPLHSNISRNQNGNELLFQMMPVVAAVSFRVVKRSLLTTPPSKKKNQADAAADNAAYAHF